MNDFKGIPVVEMKKVIRYEITKEDLLLALKLKTGDDILYQDGIGIDMVTSENGPITIDIVENRLEAVKDEVIQDIKTYGWNWKDNWVRMVKVLRDADANRFGKNANAPGLQEARDFAEKNLRPLFS